ncbi:MAG TPA: cytidine deaminase [Bacillota bacterium]|nr:cytidine deaminase [Bacillota bacterium]
MDYNLLVARALEARKNAYAPYSNLRVGAALLTGDKSIYTGVNVENVSYGATNCAERSAIFSAISKGQKDFKAIAVASDLDKTIYPCGICRQVIAEFKIPEIIVSDKDGNYKIHKLIELLPSAYEG